jgi:hypothetical protein
MSGGAVTEGSAPPGPAGGEHARSLEATNDEGKSTEGSFLQVAVSMTNLRSITPSREAKRRWAWDRQFPNSPLLIGRKLP